MNDKTPHYQSAADLFGEWRNSVLSGKPPTLYTVGDGELGRVEIGPGLVTVMGGAPGAGKTALVMQWVFEALTRTPDLRALVCNVEMSPAVLLDRQLARLSGIDLGTIRHRQFGPVHKDRLDAGMAAVKATADRLAFARPPYTLENVAYSADDFNAALLIIDYLQRFSLDGKAEADRRAAIDKMMSKVREFADTGVAVVVVAALNRGHEGKGYNPDSLTLASFRESSELEYGADDAYIVAPEPDAGTDDVVILKHLKSRHGECRDLRLRFDKLRQKFDDADWLNDATPSSFKSKPTGNGKINIDDIWRRA